MFNGMEYLAMLKQPSPFVSDDENCYRAWVIWGAKKAIAIANGTGDRYYNLECFIHKLDRYSLVDKKNGLMFSAARDVAIDIFDKMGGR